jgi:hypothetical protein
LHCSAFLFEVDPNLYIIVKPKPEEEEEEEEDEDVPEYYLPVENGNKILGEDNHDDTAYYLALLAYEWEQAEAASQLTRRHAPAT